MKITVTEMLHNKKIQSGVLVTITFLIIGTIGYMGLEHFTLLDALYMTVITITTVGFGRVGVAAAERFQKARALFVVRESGEEQLKFLQEHKYPYLEGDATTEEVLQEIWHFQKRALRNRRSP